MKDETIVRLGAIISLTGLGLYALYKGVDGFIMLLCGGGIGLLGGAKMEKLKELFKG